MSNKNDSIRQIWSKWFKANDQKQSEWAVNYLIKRGHRSYQFSTSNASLTHFIITLADENPSEALLLIKAMKAAWSSKQIREKNNGRKGYSFAMNSDIQGKLKHLSKASGKTISETLEALIKDADQFRDSQKNDMEIKKRELNSIFEKRKNALTTKINREKAVQNIEIQKLKKEIEIQNEKIQDIILEKFNQERILKENNIAIEADITSQQNELISKKIKDFNAELQEKIKSEKDQIKTLLPLQRAYDPQDTFD